MRRRWIASTLVALGLALLVGVPGAFAARPSTSVTFFPLPNGGTRPYTIVTGPDGNLWFTESSRDAIGRITPDGTITEFPLHPFSDTIGRVNIAPPPPPPPPPPPFKPPCTVPRVVGLRLAKAETKIRRAHCRVGKVTRKPAPPRELNRVLSQRPKAGKRLANGARVKLWVGKGR